MPKILRRNIKDEVDAEIYGEMPNGFDNILRRPRSYLPTKWGLRRLHALLGCRCRAGRRRRGRSDDDRVSEWTERLGEPGGETCGDVVARCGWRLGPTRIEVDNIKCLFASKLAPSLGLVWSQMVYLRRTNHDEAVVGLFSYTTYPCGSKHTDGRFEIPAEML
jgi:hypothetical protein